jgi:hypothetical protein
LQRARQLAHKLSLGFAFGFAGTAQRLGRAAAAVLVLGEEAGQALGAEASGRFRRRIALEEGERDRARATGPRPGA